MQNAGGLLLGLSTMDTVCTPRLVISTISPGNISRTYLAPTDRNVQDSEAMTHASGSTPFAVPRNKIDYTLVHYNYIH
jgi:hypothetical protein